jgi:hypothetical protein
VERVGRVTVKVSQHNRKAIMVKVDRVVQDSSADTGYGAVDCKFKENPGSYRDPKSRTESQLNETAYQGRNLYGIGEFKWGRSKKKNWRQQDQVGDRDLKDQHQEEAVTGRDGACQDRTRPTDHPSGKEVRAYWRVMDEDFEEFKLGVAKNRDAEDKRQKSYNPSRLVSTCVGTSDWVFVGNQEDTSNARDWVYQGKSRSQEDTEVDTVVDREWVYQGKTLSQENAEVDNDEARLAECPPGRVEQASWDVLGDDWTRDA